MAEFGRGAKAGLLSGLISGIIIAIGQYVLFQSYEDQVRSAISSNIPAGTTLTLDKLVTIALYTVLVSSLIAGIIFGAILGLIFSVVYNRYMNNQSLPARGLVFGSILWLVSALFGLSNLQHSSTYYAVSTLFSLVSSLVYGCSLGVFFARFRTKVTFQSISGTG